MIDQTPPPTTATARSASAIEPIEIQEEMERSFLDYAMSVITTRALPDARDGLKPVHRRILYGMDDLGARPDRSPHEVRPRHRRRDGQVPPPRRGRDLRRPRAHGPGLLPAPPARRRPRQLRHRPTSARPPSRYTECRLEPAGHADARRHRRGHRRLQRQLLGRRPASPTVLPARFPNLLVNGSQGIAVGMATNIPPHNLGEVIDATVHLIDNPEATPDDLMQFVQGPDFPTGALIMGRQGIIDAYRTGKGSIRLRAVCEIEEGERPQRRPDRRHRDAVPDVDLRHRRPHRRAGADPRRSRASPTSTTSRPAARPAWSSS